MHRDGSARGRPLRRLRAVRLRSPGGAKQPYGVWPARPSPGERTATTISGCAPETSPCRTPSRQKDRIALLAEERSWAGETAGNRDPDRLGATAKDRSVPVSAWLGVRAASAGDGCSCVVCDLQSPV